MFINLGICIGAKGVFMSLTYAAQRSEGSAYKTTAIVAVVLLHLGFLYAFTHGLNVVNIVKPFKDTVTVFIPDEKPIEQPPPPPKVKDLPPIDKVVADVPAPTPVEVPVEVPPTAPSSDTAISESASNEPTPTKSFSIKHQVNPTYPSASRRAGESGTVLLSVVVTPDGTPSDVEVERSSGFAALDQAAVEAVRKWRFKVNGASGASRLQLPVTFKLES
jgi:protein TonB